MSEICDMCGDSQPISDLRNTVDDQLYCDVCHDSLLNCTNCQTALLYESEKGHPSHCMCEWCIYDREHITYEKCLVCNTELDCTKRSYFDDICSGCFETKCSICFKFKTNTTSLLCKICKIDHFKYEFISLTKRLPIDLCNIVIDYVDDTVEQIKELRAESLTSRFDIAENAYRIHP